MERWSDGPDGITDHDNYRVVDSVEDVDGHRPAAELFHIHVDLRQEAYIVGGDGLDVREQGGGSRLHERGIVGKGLGVGGFLVSFAHNGEGRESPAESEPSASRDVGEEDIVHKACGCEGCIGQGDREIHSVGAFGEKRHDDSVLPELWTVDEGGMDLGEAGLVCHVAELQDELSEGRGCACQQRA